MTVGTCLLGAALLFGLLGATTDHWARGTGSLRDTLDRTALTIMCYGAAAFFGIAGASWVLASF